MGGSGRRAFESLKKAPGACNFSFLLELKERSETTSIVRRRKKRESRMKACVDYVRRNRRSNLERFGSSSTSSCCWVSPPKEPATCPSPSSSDPNCLRTPRSPHRCPSSTHQSEPEVDRSQPTTTSRPSILLLLLLWPFSNDLRRNGWVCCWCWKGRTTVREWLPGWRGRRR